MGTGSALSNGSGRAGRAPSFGCDSPACIMCYSCLLFSCRVLAGAGYAHMLIVVAFLVVKIFGFLVITRNPTMRFGPKLEEIFL